MARRRQSAEPVRYQHSMNQDWLKLVTVEDEEPREAHRDHASMSNPDIQITNSRGQQ